MLVPGSVSNQYCFDLLDPVGESDGEGDLARSIVEEGELDA